MPLDSYQVTPELIAEIDEAHSLGAGMSGLMSAVSLITHGRILADKF